MKAELEAQIAAKEQEIAALRAQLDQLVQTVPAEYHSITREIYDRLKALFG